MPTDNQIFNHMRPIEDFCGCCGSDDVERVEHDDYSTYKCLVCDFEPAPGEDD